MIGLIISHYDYS